MKFNKILPRPNNMTLNNELTYSFTSGTTGIPKGVIGTHRMVISQVESMVGHYELNATDVHMSFLPIAHTFERFVTWSLIARGSNIKYAKFPITEIFKDLEQIRPTTTVMVPRLLNKFYPVLKGIREK